MSTPLNTTHVVLTFRDGRVLHEVHTEHNAWKLTTTYNRTAYDATVTDVVAEWDDDMNSTATVWHDNLAHLATGLDLRDAEDRSTFRLRVQAACAGVRTSLIRDLAADVGATDATKPAHRVLADAWIGRTSRRG